MKEAKIVRNQILATGVKQIGTTAVYAYVMQYGVQYDTISDFLDNASGTGETHMSWKQTMTGLGANVCGDLLSFHVGATKDQWLKLGKSIYKYGKCTRDGTKENPTCLPGKCTKGVEEHITEETCTEDSTRTTCEWKSMKTDDDKCSECGADWGTGWDLLKSCGDVLLAVAAKKAGLDAQLIRTCIISLDEIRRCKDLKSLKAVLCNRGKELGIRYGTSQAFKWLGPKITARLNEYLGKDANTYFKDLHKRFTFKLCDLPRLPQGTVIGDLFNSKLPEKIEVDLLEKIKTFFMVQCRRKLGHNIADTCQELMGQVGAEPGAKSETSGNGALGWFKGKTTGWMPRGEPLPPKTPHYGTVEPSSILPLSSAWNNRRRMLGDLSPVTKRGHSSHRLAEQNFTNNLTALILAIEEQGFEFCYA